MGKRKVVKMDKVDNKENKKTLNKKLPCLTVCQFYDHCVTRLEQVTMKVVKKECEQIMERCLDKAFKGE